MILYQTHLFQQVIFMQTQVIRGMCHSLSDKQKWTSKYAAVVVVVVVVGGEA